MKPEPTFPEQLELAKDQGRIWAAQYANIPGEENQMKLWYLAHPVSGDDSHSLELNLATTLDIQQTLWLAGVNAVCPWFSLVKIFGPAEDETLDRALKVGFEIIRRFDGLILTGHKLSEGMDAELRVALEFEKPIVNFIGMSPVQINKLAGIYNW